MKRYALAIVSSLLFTLVCQFAAAGGRILFQFKEPPSVFLELPLSLLPSGSRITEIDRDHLLAKRIDRQVLRILKTNVGQKFCEVVIEDVRDVERAFLIGHDAAEEAMEICRGHFATKFTHRPFRKRYFLAEVDFESAGFSEHKKVDGWTTPRNETVIFAREEELTDERLVRTLAHEMAVSYDAKEQIGFGGLLDYPKLGLLTTPGSCLVQQLVRVPQLKHSLSAIRAFTVEAAIARELEVSLPEGFANWMRLSCVDRLRFMKRYSLAWTQALASESLVSLLLDSPLYCSATPVQSVGFDVAAEALADLSLVFDDGRRVNACDYMTEGLPFVPGLSFHGGPGPRVTGGWRQLVEPAVTVPAVATPNETAGSSAVKEP